MNIWQITIKGGAQITTPAEVDSLTTYVLLEQEDWFEYEMEFVRNFAKPGMNCLDIGACYGVYAKTMAQQIGPDDMVYAFEPHKEVVEHLKKGKPDNMEIIPQVLSDTPGQASLSKEAAEYRKSFKGKDYIQTTLDQWWKDFGKPEIHLVKLDVNGKEAKVIQGGSEFFTQNSPVVIFSADKMEQSAEAMESLGYKIFNYVPGVSRLAPLTSKTKEPFCLNLIACKQETVEQYNLQERSILPVFENWETCLASMPWTNEVLSKWKAQTEAKAYLEALDHLCKGETSRALPVLTTQFNPENPLSSLSITYARALYLHGYRAQAVEVLRTLNRACQFDQPFDLELPFLPPLPSQDQTPIVDSFKNWTNARIMEAFISLNMYTGYFTGDKDLEFLKALHNNPDKHIESDRRLALWALRNGKTIKIKPESKLLTDEHLNPHVWESLRAISF